MPTGAQAAGLVVANLIAAIDRESRARQHLAQLVRSQRGEIRGLNEVLSSTRSESIARKHAVDQAVLEIAKVRTDLGNYYEKIRGLENQLASCMNERDELFAALQRANAINAGLREPLVATKLPPPDETKLRPPGGIEVLTLDEFKAAFQRREEARKENSA